MWAQVNFSQSLWNFSKFLVRNGPESKIRRSIVDQNPKNRVHHNPNSRFSDWWPRFEAFYFFEIRTICWNWELSFVSRRHKNWGKNFIKLKRLFLHIEKIKLNLNKQIENIPWFYDFLYFILIKNDLQ